jgi:N-acetyl-anhydromuramyl-L-alanine amidase AmpD
MLVVNSLGKVIDARVKLAISPSIERGNLPVVHGIVVHQTDSSTAASTLNGYKRPRANGAHFLIDKDGTIYQTASLHQKTYHVGFIKSRCLLEKTCSPADLQRLRGKKVGAGIGHVEMRKPYPRRYPTNEDAIGVEIVSRAKNGVFESITAEQQASFKWLLKELLQTLHLAGGDVFRHGAISWKLPSEGASATW